MLAALGAAIGYATDFGWGGVVAALVVGDLPERRLVLRRRPAGAAVVRRARGVPSPIRPTTCKQLVNVVTEMSIAGGLPMPKVYTIDDTAPNAFATGRDPKHASVAVTTGLLAEDGPRGAAGRDRRTR